MTTQSQTEALKSAIEFAEFCLEELDLSYMASNQAKRLVEKAKEALAQPDRHELQAKGEHPAPCARFCEANAFKIEIRNLKSKLAQQSNEQVEPVAIVAEVHMSRYTIEWTNGSLPEGTQLFAHPPVPTAQPKEPEQEPVALPPVQFEKVAEGIEIGYDFLGGVDIRLGGEFVYVHINYDYRYTHNAARKALADQIVGLLTTPPQSKEPEQEPVAKVTYLSGDERTATISINQTAWLPAGTNLYTTPPQRKWVGLTDEELRKLCEDFWLYPRKLLQAIEAKLKEKNNAY